MIIRMCRYAHDHPPRLAVQLDQKVHVQLGACHGDQREQRHITRSSST